MVVLGIKVVPDFETIIVNDSAGRKLVTSELDDTPVRHEDGKRTYPAVKESPINSNASFFGSYAVRVASWSGNHGLANASPLRAYH